MICEIRCLTKERTWAFIRIWYIRESLFFSSLYKIKQSVLRIQILKITTDTFFFSLQLQDKVPYGAS